MAENSAISWTDHTMNFWIGCTHVGPGCDHCYADNLSARYGWAEFAPGAPRHRTAPSAWRLPYRWNRMAEEHKAQRGHWPRVFSLSLGDFFDNEVPADWRADAWRIIRDCDKLQWLIVTKRVPNIEQMLPAAWCSVEAGRLAYGHVVIIATAVNQTEANRDVPRLVALKRKYPWLKIGLSLEPLLGPINLAPWLADLDWVITGGESKQMEGPRPLVALEAPWVRFIDRQCAAAGVPHHFKQWGHTIPVGQIDVATYAPRFNTKIPLVGRVVHHPDMGRMLDGCEINGFVAQ